MSLVHVDTPPPAADDAARLRCSFSVGGLTRVLSDKLPPGDALLHQLTVDATLDGGNMINQCISHLWRLMDQQYSQPEISHPPLEVGRIVIETDATEEEEDAKDGDEFDVPPVPDSPRVTGTCIVGWLKQLDQEGYRTLFHVHGTVFEYVHDKRPIYEYQATLPYRCLEVVSGPLDVYPKCLLETALCRGGPFVSFNKFAPLQLAIFHSRHVSSDVKLRYAQLFGPHHWEVGKFDEYPQRHWTMDGTPLIRECKAYFRPSVGPCNAMSSSRPFLPTAWGTWGGWALQAVDHRLLRSLQNHQRGNDVVQITLPPAPRAFIEGDFGAHRRRRRPISLQLVFEKLNYRYNDNLVIRACTWYTPGDYGLIIRSFGGGAYLYPGYRPTQPGSWIAIAYNEETKVVESVSPTQYFNKDLISRTIEGQLEFNVPFLLRHPNLDIPLLSCSIALTPALESRATSFTRIILRIRADLDVQKVVERGGLGGDDLIFIDFTTVSEPSLPASTPAVPNPPLVDPTRSPVLEKDRDGRYRPLALDVPPRVVPEGGPSVNTQEESEEDGTVMFMSVEQQKRCFPDFATAELEAGEYFDELALDAETNEEVGKESGADANLLKLKQVEDRLRAILIPSKKTRPSTPTKKAEGEETIDPSGAADVMERRDSQALAVIHEQHAEYLQRNVRVPPSPSSLQTWLASQEFLPSHSRRPPPSPAQFRK